MANPTNRQEFTEWCLRKLGAPVLQINIAPNQLEDRVDEAIQLFREYHNDATGRDYYSHRVTAGDVLTKSITIPDEIIEVMRVCSVASTKSGGFFNFQYQFYLNDVYGPGGISVGGNMQYIESTLQYLDMIDHLFNQEKTMQFNRHLSKVYFNADWNNVKEGDYVVMEVRRIFDMDTNAKVWNDRWLKEYTCALIKIQWGDNLKKYADISLPGNVKLNGQVIYDEGVADREKLEKELKDTWSDPPFFMIG